MPSRLKFRHRIGLLVALAAVALITVAAVTFALGRRNEDQLTGIERRYLPLIELDGVLRAKFARLPRAFEDAASAADEAKLEEADRIAHELRAKLREGATTIADNGGDPSALETELDAYYGNAREVSAALMDGRPIAALAHQIETMRRAQQTFGAHLEAATRPDRRRLAQAFAIAHDTQTTALWVDIVVAGVALALMALLSWRLIRHTVRALQAVSSGVERLARGEFGAEIDVPSGDELGELAREANRTAERLRAYREDREREDWIKTGVAALADRIVGEHELATLGDQAMRYLSGYVGAEAAAVFASDETGRFVRLGATGPGAERLGAELAFADPPAVRVETGASAHVASAPFVHHDRVMGALALGFASRPSERTVELLRRIREVVGTAFVVAEARERERELLAETQRQAIAAQTANRELEAFSYSVSHDLRAPLRGIDGFSQALLEDHADKLPPKGQDYLRRIRAGAQRMADLIDDMLRLSRVSRADFKREPVDLAAIVASITAELRRGDPGRGDVQVEIEGELSVSADPRLIRIALENLIGNAWKFTSKTAAPVIEVGVMRDGDEPVYFVRDNGAGFDMKYADRLFGAFQRLHTDKEFPGTGIGLATVQRIVSRHAGRIWVDAAVGRGATFFFTLPDEAQGAHPS